MQFNCACRTKLARCHTLRAQLTIARARWLVLTWRHLWWQAPPTGSQPHMRVLSTSTRHEQFLNASETIVSNLGQVHVSTGEVRISGGPRLASALEHTSRQHINRSTSGRCWRACILTGRVQDGALWPCAADILKDVAIVSLHHSSTPPGRDAS